MRAHAGGAYPCCTAKQALSELFVLKPRLRRCAAIAEGTAYAMSLSPEEYRDHLATTAVRAGFSFGEVVLPQSHEFHLGRMRFHYLDWGNKHLPTIVF